MAVTESSTTPGAPLPGLLLRLVRDQRVAFLIVGGINTAIGFGWFVLFHRIAGPSVGYMGTLLMSHICAVLCAFVLHRRFVFKVRGHVLLDLARFELVNLGALGVNAILLPFFVEIVGLHVLVAQALATCVSIVSTFFGHMFFSFRRKSAVPSEPA